MAGSVSVEQPAAVLGQCDRAFVFVQRHALDQSLVL
jgi:hypothetical protein